MADSLDLKHLLTFLPMQYTILVYLLQYRLTYINRLLSLLCLCVPLDNILFLLAISVNDGFKLL